jgi:hypothetical protein
MQRAKSVFTSLVLLTGLACSSMEVSSQKSNGVNLAQYHTYAWSVDSSGKAQETQSFLQSGKKGDPWIQSTIQQELNTALENRGFKLASPRQKPDFVVVYYAGAQNRIESSAGMGAGMGTYPGWGGGYWNSAPMVSDYREGTLVVNFIDAKSGTPFWRGVASDIIGDSGVTKKELRSAAQSIVSQYEKDLQKAAEQTSPA